LQDDGSWKDQDRDSSAASDEPGAEPFHRHAISKIRNGSVTFRSRFLDFTRRFVHHCHTMNHEELGTMQVVEVYRA
jgi:FtsP/CotA-like multicopper oxidase with cupredoxin domain